MGGEEAEIVKEFKAVRRDASAAPPQSGDFGGGERARHEDIRLHRQNAAGEGRGEAFGLVGARRDEHLGAADGPARRDEAVEAAFARPVRDGRMRSDARAAPLGGGGETADVIERVQAEADRLPQRARIGVGALAAIA